MAKVDYQQLAGQILKEVGGEPNVSTMTHCATRLRLKIKDMDKVHTTAMQELPGVVTTVEAGGQYQIVIGNDVPLVFEQIGKMSKLVSDTSSDGDDEGEKGNIFDRFIQLISSLFSPLLWPMAGLGLFKAILVLVVQFGWLSDESTTYTILNASSDAFFYFLPIFLAITAARRFKANQFTAMAIAAALVYPSIVALTELEQAVTFMGIPVVIMSYTSSVIPIIVAVWAQGYVERFLNKFLPHWLRNFTTPLLTVFIMVPLTLMTVGPVTTIIAQWLSDGIAFLMTTLPWLGGAIMGGLWQVFVMFGMHWAFIPVMLNDLATTGITLLAPPLMAAVLAQAAATLAVFIRSRSAKRREVAGPAAVSGFLAGITEPAIYGVNLPLKLPFYFGIVGGAIGGAIIGIGELASNAFVFPSLLAYPAFLSHGNFTFMIIGTVVAMVVAFLLTFFFVDREKEQEATAVPETDSEQDTVKALDAEGGVIEDIGAPVAGKTIPLSEVNDKVFASGAMGPGYGIIPSSGTFVSPVSGKVAVAMKSGHAFGLKSDDGVEVLVHIGLDTVQLDGKHFEPKVEKGQMVKKGDTLAVVDLDAVQKEGFDTTTVVVITNAKKLSDVVTADPAEVTQGSSTMVVTV